MKAESFEDIMQKSLKKTPTIDVVPQIW